MKAMRDYATAKGWLIYREYVDAGYSARTDARPQFKETIADAKRHRFNYVLVHKLDRFSPSRQDAVTYKALLKKEGILVISVTEPTEPDSTSSVILEGMLEVIAEWYSVNLSHKVAKGKRERAMQGLYNRDLPFGFDKGADSVPVVNEAETQVVRLIFEKYASGQSSY